MKPLPLLITCAVGVTAGVLLGRSKPGRASAASRAFWAETRSLTPADSGSEGGVPASEDADARIGRVFSALQEPAALRKRFALLEAVRGLSARDLPALVQRADALPLATRGQLVPALVERWFELDFDAAQNWMRTHPQEYSLISVWAKANPDAAIQEALANPDKYYATRLLVEASSELASGDARAQVGRLTALPKGKLRDDVLSYTLAVWSDTDPASAFAALGEISPGKTRDGARFGVMRKWATRDPAAALTQLGALLPTLQAGVLGNELVTEIAKLAAGEDPRLVLGWLSEIPVEFRTVPAIGAARAWAAKEPAAALDWCVENGVDVAHSEWDIGGSRGAGVLGETFASQPAAVVEWLEARPAGPDRDRLLECALKESLWRAPQEQLFGDGPAFAMRLFDQLAEESQVRTAAALGRKRAEQSDFTDLRDWAENFAPGPARADAVAGAMGAAYMRDASRVEALLASTASTADRDAALRGLAGAMSHAAPAEAGSRALAINDPDLRRETLGNVFTAWQRRDPDLASAWLQDTAAIPVAWKQAWQRNP